MRADLRVVGGKHHDKIITLPDKKFLIGREQDCHLRPNSESVSRHHCAITIDEYGVHIRDLGSTNGTLVNGERIQGMVKLTTGDALTVGKLEFQILIYETARVTQPAAADQVAAQADELNSLMAGPDSGNIRETTDISAPDTDAEVPVTPQAPTGPMANTGIFSGDTTITRAEEVPQQPTAQRKEARIAPPPLKLPSPEETGISEESDNIGSAGSESKDESGDTKQDASNLAADIIRKYRERKNED